MGAATKFLKPLPLLPLPWLTETATATSATFSKCRNRYALPLPRRRAYAANCGHVMTQTYDAMGWLGRTTFISARQLLINKIIWCDLMSGMEFDPWAQVVCTRSTWFVREHDHNELPMPMPMCMHAHCPCLWPPSPNGHPLQMGECKQRGSCAFLLP